MPTSPQHKSATLLAAQRLAVLEAALAYRAPPIRPCDFCVPVRVVRS